MVLVLAPAHASAEWHIKPFFGGSFAGVTTFLDFENAAGSLNKVFGVSGLRLGSVWRRGGRRVGAGSFLGGEGMQTVGCAGTTTQCVVHSSVRTFTGNVVIAVPRRLTTYTLRPYFVGGAGIMHARSELAFGALLISSTLPTLDVGGGVTGFLSERIGLGWDVRYFRSLGTEKNAARALAPSSSHSGGRTWRSAIRY